MGVMVGKLTKQQIEARKKLFEEIRDTWPLRKGKNEFLKSLSQENVTRKDAMLAQCYHCCGGYEKGPFDCKEAICSLYEFMPYRDERSRKEFSEEQRVELITRLAAGRERKKNENN